MKVSWTKRWAALWVLWIAEFLVLEAVGLGCERLNIPGCSTASSFMVSNLGVGLMIIQTLAVAAVLCWHWTVVDKDNRRRAQWLQEHRHELRFGWRKDKTLGTMLLSLDDFYTAWERLMSRLKPVAWKLDYDFTQYRGSCVGHGWAEWGRALPVRDPWTNTDAEHIYDLCKEIDGCPNEEGTDNESAVRVMKKLGRLKSAAWTASEATLRTHLQKTPCVFGATWTEGMCTTDRNGFIHPTGADVGGHDTCILEYHPGLRPYCVGANSWQSMHRFKIYASDMAKIVKRGEIVAALELPLGG